MARYKVSDNVLAALIQQETGGDVNAVSPKGARGLTQIMPATAANPGYGVTPLRDWSIPEQKRFTKDYLGELVDRTGSLPLGLAAYNSGLGTVKKAGGIPNIPETKSYVENIMNMVNPIGTANASETPYSEPKKPVMTRAEFMAMKQQQQPDKQVMTRAEFMAMKQAQSPSLSWKDVPGKALQNLPESAGRFVTGLGEAVSSPIETAKNVAGIVRGGMQNILPESVTNFLVEQGITPESRPQADAIGQFYKQRYGSEEGFKQAIATDPVGVMADISAITGGAGALAKAGGMARTANVAGKVSAATNPINLAGKAIAGTGKLAGIVTDPILGLTTGAGTSSIKAAREAGKAGGSQKLAFTENMRGQVPIEEVLGEAKGALKTMGTERGTAYREGMQDVGISQRVLPFNNIDRAVNDALSVGSYRGESINRSAAGVQKAIQKQVNKWKELPPEEYHTAEGLDALKKSIGDIRDSSEYGTPSRVIADKVYNTIKNEIIKEAPEYKGVMADYEKSIRLQHEIERALSLGDKASADTAVRKLQSLTRNNVNTNYGNRLALAKQLENFGAENLLTKISGQALSSITPRGLQAVTGTGLFGAGIATANPLTAGLIAQSPRVMGELEQALGTGLRYGGKITGNKLTKATVKSAPLASISARKKQ